jgi:hypothetical protein
LHEGADFNHGEAMADAARKDPSHVGSYTAREAARILDLPVSTVRDWSFGQSGRLHGGQCKRFPAVIRP